MSKNNSKPRWKWHIIAGCLGGIICFLLLATFIPRAICVDGWQSPSIGRMGACSHHGGVKSHRVLYFIIAAGSSYIGYRTAQYFEPNRILRNSHAVRPARPFSFEAKLIRDAIKDGRKIRFLYKTARESRHIERTVNPREIVYVQHRHGYGETECVRGFCDLRHDTRTFALNRMRELRTV
jgi:hypothetical protein